MSKMVGDSNNNSTPPFAHAVGGSLGSALALLLLYPLERARIEVQTVVARLEAKERDKERNNPSYPNKQQGDGINSGKRTLPRRVPTTATSTRSSSFQENEENFIDNIGDSDADPDDDNPELLACFKKVWSRGNLYKGAGPLTWTLAISNFIFFFVNNLVKRKIFALYSRRATASPPYYLSLLASCLAGSINVLLTNPLWVTNLRILSDQSTFDNLWQEMVHVARTMGPSALWQGTTASLMLVSNPVIQFFCYEQIKSIRLLQLKQQQQTGFSPPNHLSPVEAFAFGALAKAIATITTYPIQLAQAVLRMQNNNKHHKNNDSDNDEGNLTHNGASQISKNSNGGTLQCLISIYSRDGFGGLYTGMRAKLLQTVLTAALTFLTYEQILAAVQAIHQKLLLKKGRTHRSAQ